MSEEEPNCWVASRFSNMNEEDLWELAPPFTSVRYIKLARSSTQGNRGDKSYVVVEGHVNIHVPGEHSREI
jgi:hypothetical protein